MKTFFKQWAKGAPTFAPPKRAKATLEERLATAERIVADLQFKLQFITIIDHVDPKFGHIYGWMFNGVRVAGNSRFWLDQDAGQGAGFSIGDDFDRFALYVEKEGTQHTPGQPSVAAYFASLAQGPNPNHAVVAIAGGSSVANVGVVASPMFMLDATADGTGTGFMFRQEGIQATGKTDALYVGTSAADAVKVWAKPAGRGKATGTRPAVRSHARSGKRRSAGSQTRRR